MIPTSFCPNCRHLLDASTPLAPGEEVLAGDWTVCAYCATPLRFDALLIPRLPTIPVPLFVQQLAKKIRRHVRK